jgi:pimeloyl-ACP methyl ester carboxylesterase
MMRLTSPPRRQLTATFTVCSLLGTAFLVPPWRASAQEHAGKATSAKFTEELVHVRSEDGIDNGGAIFAPTKDTAKPIAVIWIHGAGVNFYYPTYVRIGRALAQRGYTCITGNLRTHDVGTIAGWRDGKPIRGGGLWALPSETMRDLAAWIGFAQARGFKQVVLVGHSAGAWAIRVYQAEKQDGRVVGLVMASGGIRPSKEPLDREMVAQATRLVADGLGDDLLHGPKRPVPKFVSAATLLDFEKEAPELRDFFGVVTPKPAVTRVRCPLLAFFGTKGDGTEADLDLLKTCINRQATGPSRVDTVMIRNADHMYNGEEAQVAETIAKWADTVVPTGASKGDAHDKR